MVEVEVRIDIISVISSCRNCCDFFARVENIPCNSSCYVQTSFRNRCDFENPLQLLVVVVDNVANTAASPIPNHPWTSAVVKYKKCPPAPLEVNVVQLLLLLPALLLKFAMHLVRIARGASLHSVLRSVVQED